MKANKTYEKYKAQVAPETKTEVDRNMRLLNEFLADYNYDDWTLSNAILWGMQKEKQETIDKACKWLRQHAISVINIDAFRKAMEE